METQSLALNHFCLDKRAGSPFYTQNLQNYCGLKEVWSLWIIEAALEVACDFGCESIWNPEFLSS